MKVSFLSVNTQFENLGDALINREMIKLLSQHGRLVIDTKSTPDWFVEMLDLPPGSKKVYGKTALLAEMVKAKIAGNTPYYFYMPGGSFGDYSYPRLIKAMFILSISFALSLLGMRFCSLGMSFERLGWKYKLYLKAKSLVLYKFFVRDEESSFLLKRSGIYHDGILPDFSFNLFSKEPEARSHVRRVCFSFRTDQYAGQLQKCISYASTLIKKMPPETEYFISVQVDRDLKGMEQFSQAINDHNGVEADLIHQARNIDELSEIYRTMDLMISNRLHVLLLAGSVGCRLLACSDERNRKVSGLFSTIGRQDLVIGENFTSEDVAVAVHSDPIDGRANRQALRDGIEKIFSSSSD